jgi:hypothetical protein
VRIYAAIYVALPRNTKRSRKNNKGKAPMTVSFVEQASSIQAPDTRVFRSAVTRIIRAANPAINKVCKMAFAVAGLLTVMIALAALDVWIWVPHFRN